MWLRNLERIVARLRRRREAIAFATWSGERFRLERRNDILRRGLKAQRRWLRRLRHFSVQRAWRTWTSLVQSVEKLIGRAASSDHPPQISEEVDPSEGRKAYGTWVSNMWRSMRNLYRVVKRLEHRMTAKAFDTWSLRNFSLDKRVDSIRRVLVAEEAAT